MANKKEVFGEIETKSILSLEKSDPIEFAWQLELRGAKHADWEKFKKQLAGEIARARITTTPQLAVKSLAYKTGVHRNMVHHYERGTRMPMLFTLWLLAKGCGKKLRITIE